MAILQLNIWTCEICGLVEIVREEPYPFDDPVVVYPPGEEWGWVGGDIPGQLGKLACPKCKQSHD